MDDRRAVVLTGATGFLGGHLLAALVGLGHTVIVLGRPSRETPLAERIDHLLDWFGLADRRSAIQTYEADLTIEGFGLSPGPYGALCDTAGPILHCASDTRFSERKRLEIADANLNGLNGVLALARDAKSPWFHYVSTAYAAGTDQTVCREELGNPQGFANVYEETKAQAEQRVSSECIRQNIPFTLIRPSIVYGDSRSGRSTGFQALYFHVRSLLNIRDIYLGDLQDHGGRKSREVGVQPDGQGNLILPLRVYLPSRGTVNLIPVDYFVSSALRILENPQDGGVYHITSDRPKAMDELAVYCERFLNIRGIEIVDGPPPKGNLRNPAEELFNRSIEPYRPYLSDTRTFERARTIQVTEGLPVPELTYDVFKRCMDFAVEVGWKLDF
jgi:nucleoside-diphosphate-sugar epimerase